MLALQILQVHVTEEDNELLPRLFIVYLNDSIAKWLSERFNLNLSNSVTELVFRPFLRWLDKNMENLFEEGLKNVGCEFNNRFVSSACGCI